MCARRIAAATNPVAAGQPERLSLHGSWQDWDVFAGLYLLAVFGHYDVAVRPRGGGNVAGALPANQFYLRVLEFAGEDCWQKALQAGLHANFGFQLRMDELNFRGDMPASASSMGRAKSSKVTMVETGFPGSPKK